MVSNIILKAMQRAGEFTIVQVCTDTCSTMKATWRKVEEACPWVVRDTSTVHRYGRGATSVLRVSA
eukprot:5030829-Pleurochrysis_carterae.AAC.1